MTAAELPELPLLLASPTALLPAVLDLLESTHERSLQTYPGHSSVGGCRRAAGYGYTGELPDVAWEPHGSVAAWVGTAVHTAWLPVLRTLLHPARIELATTWQPWPPDVPDHLGAEWGPLPPITGHVDLYRRQSELALDVKTVSRHQLDYVRRLGDEVGVAARPKDLMQLHTNAASLQAEGKPCSRVAVLYVCTETSQDRQDEQGLLWVQSVDDSLVEAAARWWQEVTMAESVDDLPRDERGPGLSWRCDSCEWLRKCWGPTAVPGIVGGQEVLAVDEPAVADALAKLADATARYTTAGRDQRAADADKEFYRAVLGATDPGTYRGDGVAYSLEWKPGQVRLDQRAAVDLLELHGLQVPRSRGRRSPKVQEVATDAPE